MDDVRQAAANHVELRRRALSQHFKDTMGGPVYSARYETWREEMVDAFEAGAEWQAKRDAEQRLVPREEWPRCKFCSQRMHPGPCPGESCALAGTEHQHFEGHAEQPAPAVMEIVAALWARANVEDDQPGLRSLLREAANALSAKGGE